MKIQRDLSRLEWSLTGWMPHIWEFGGFLARGNLTDAEVHPIPAKVPGSVQISLRDAGLDVFRFGILAMDAPFLSENDSRASGGYQFKRNESTSRHPAGRRLGVPSGS